MKLSFIVFLLAAVLFLVSCPSAITATNQAELDKLLDQIAKLSAAISLLKKQVAEFGAFSPSLQIKTLDKDLILQKIEEGKEFLFRVENKTEHGFYKKYDALNNSFEARLHTVYSASIIYTFLYIYDFNQDERVLENIPDWGDFLLSMQNREEGSKAYGAFHYSFYLDSSTKENKFPVGTSALSVFTLLRLYDLTGEEKYLDSAKLAGNWLITMQKPDGVIRPYGRYSDGKWILGKKESLLYNGQVLSALSKLYWTTGEAKYYDTAERIAKHFAEKYEKENGGYIEDEYRTKNPISNSWVVMSLIDFYKSSEDLPNGDYYKNIIFELSNLILKNQIDDSNDIQNYGRWEGAYSTSGIGWISEVMSETYHFCKKEKRLDCEKYKDATIKGIFWVIQNTYSEENTSFLKSPEMAIGGIYWNQENKYVRTDSVCHALNSYTRIINDLPDGTLIQIK